MNIAIPTYNRYDNFKTISYLKENNIPYEWITIFVANEEEYDKYSFLTDYKIVIGVLGICNQRNFISNYYNEGEYIISMDDDIETITHKEDKTLKEWLEECLEYLKTSNLGLLTISPSSNPFFFQQKNKAISFKDGNYLAVGVFHVYKNHKDFKMDIDMVEDYDRSIMYLKYYGKNIRYYDVFIKTEYWGKGGLSTQRTKETYLENVNKLLAKYPNYLSSKPKLIKQFDKKEKVPNVYILKKIKPIEDKEILVYPKFKKTIFDNLYEMLNKAKFSIKKGRNNRYNFPSHYAMILGLTRQRFTGKVCNSVDTEKNYDIFNELKKVANIINPDFIFTSIHINKNLVCPKHKDKKNVGKSMIISIGDYTGCKLMIENKEYDTHYRPVVFNGSFLEHYNTTNLVGSKYSIIYYNAVPIQK